MKTKVLLYCTKAKKQDDELYLLEFGDFKGVKNKHYNTRGNMSFPEMLHNRPIYTEEKLNGKIVAECEVECEIINGKNIRSFEKTSCLDTKSLIDYLKPYLVWDRSVEKMLYHFYDYDFLGNTLHITNLKAFDRPLELREVKHIKKPSCNSCPYQYEIDCEYHKEVECECEIPLTKAPQNMQWVYLNGIRYCLISVRSKWLCKIMNGEKTDEIRRKVLKGM